MKKDLILKYAERGYKIFPVQEDSKAPATKNGFQDATDDLGTIKKWWDANPNYNIGLPMALNGLIAVDIDRHGEINGFETFDNYIISNELSDLPLTVEAVTANNGKHKIFKAPEGFKPVGKLADGVDIKYNGYIVIAPSEINGNSYEWLTEQGLLDIQPTPLPKDWQNCLNPNHSAETECLKLPEGDYPTSNAETIANECNFIRHCIDDVKSLSEPDWKFGLIGVIPFCEGGADFAHKWSGQYFNYSYAETQDKINSSLKFSKPTSCAGIQSTCGDKYCKNCLYKGKIKSPIVLGYNKLEYTGIADEGFKEPELNIEFPIEVFPEKIKKFVQNASYVMDAPPEYFSAGIITVTAFLINSQGFLNIKKNSWAEPAILWMALVGEPGKKKKTPVLMLINRILNTIDKQLEAKYIEELQKYDIEMLKYDVNLKNWKKDGNIDAEPPIAPKKPVRELLYASDTTIEALSENQSKNPHGIGIMRDELSGFIEGFNKYQKGGGNDKEYYLSSFSGDEYIVSRKGVTPFKVKPYHNIFGGIQPSKVEYLLFNDLKVTDGFTERFLFCLTDYIKRGKMTNDELDEELKLYLENLMLDIYSYFTQDGIKYYELSKEARERLFEILDYLDKETLDDANHELLQSYLEKIKTCIPRFALILHCLCNHKEQYVSKETIDSAYKIAQYFINCFIKITKIAIKIKCNSLEHYTVQWLKLQKKTSITPSQLHLSNKSKYKSIEIARECLHSIASANFGKIVKTANGFEKWVRYAD